MTPRPMVNAVLIDCKERFIDTLRKQLYQHCPDVKVSGTATCHQAGSQLIRSMAPNLVFIDAEMTGQLGIEDIQLNAMIYFETIFLSNRRDFAMDAIRCQAVDYLIRPVQKANLIQAVEKAVKKITEHEDLLYNKKMLQRMLDQPPVNELIGIPTLEGFEFIRVGDIVRCEGLQKCTRIVTNDRSDIISAYNIGEFKKLLDAYGFFAPHKSHLINLREVLRYNKEGTITMRDQSHVPVARRRKVIFLQQLKHL